jgi:hypothetical protein
MDSIPAEIKEEWTAWVSQRPIYIQKVANEIVPWKKYRMKSKEHDTSYFTPVSYEESEKDENGIIEVTVTCQKHNDLIPILGGYCVFGIKPDDLVELN